MSETAPDTKGRRQSAGAFTISLIVHLAFVLLAIFVFHKWVEPPPPEKVDFLPGGGGGGNEGRSANRIQAQKMMATSQATTKRVAVDGLASFTLPDLSADFADASLPMPMADASMGSGGGAGGGHGTGIGTGTGPGSGPGSGPGLGRGFVSTTVFGSKEGRSDALAGRLYDFKQDRRGKEVEYDIGNVSHFNDRVLEIQKRRFRESSFRDYFQAPDTLYLTQLAIPLVPASEGPKLFGAEDKMKPSGWFAHYNGKLKAPKDMTFRFVGSADDYIGIFTKGRFRLIATRPEIQTTLADDWEPAETDQEFPGPMGTLVFGDWITVRAGEEFEMDLAIGERPGGVVGFLLLVQERDQDYRTTSSGRPILPVFSTEAISPEIRDRITKGFANWEFDWDHVPVFTNRSGDDPLLDPFR